MKRMSTNPVLCVRVVGSVVVVDRADDALAIKVPLSEMSLVALRSSAAERYCEDEESCANALKTPCDDPGVAEGWLLWATDAGCALSVTVWVAAAAASGPATVLSEAQTSVTRSNFMGFPERAGLLTYK